MTFSSWGRYPTVTQNEKLLLRSGDIPQVFDPSQSALPVGLGRSYGDSCLNDGGLVAITTPLNHFIEFDRERGILTAEAGVSLDEILKVIVPAGWFLPVSPGTRFVTVGGAIANDIHGKNHHRAGCFGNHVTSFEIFKSTGEKLKCSKTENSDLFRATIGGLGLTGIISQATFALTKISNQYIDEEIIPFKGLEHFFELSEESHEDWDYTVSWVDCVSRIPRGLFMRGNFNTSRGESSEPVKTKPMLPFPIEAPSWLLNSLSIQIFNELYFHRIPSRGAKKITHYQPFFYPLDAIHNWNLMYGKRGFLQWQCVVPIESNAISEIFRQISLARQGSFLAVLKTFGSIASEGLLSFPRPGVTLALDFGIKGEKTFKLLEQLDAIVRLSGGAIYPAKDARMSSEMFKLSFPKLDEFKKFKDPGLSSSFWRRVTNEK